MTRRSAWILSALLVTLPMTAAAQQAGETTTGERLFKQYCSVCHLKPTILANQFGPVLSKDTVEGKEMALKEFIAKGTQRMPGFQYTLEPRQVDSVLAYLKTVPTPAPAPAQPAAPH
jgi:mono/diheme cytochrome c family protein